MCPTVKSHFTLGYMIQWFSGFYHEICVHRRWIKTCFDIRMFDFKTQTLRNTCKGVFCVLYDFKTQSAFQKKISNGFFEKIVIKSFSANGIQ
jgi:hypothetical protein